MIVQDTTRALVWKGPEGKRVISIIEKLLEEFAPERIRTSNRPVRSRVLYPVELPVHGNKKYYRSKSLFSQEICAYCLKIDAFSGDTA